MSETRLSLTLANRRDEVSRLVDRVEIFGRSHGLVADDIHAVQLLLDEVVFNIIRHAYDDVAAHDIGVSLSLKGSRLKIEIEDDGKPYDPTTTPAPNLDLPIDERPIGGLGVHIVRSLVESMHYDRTNGRNVL